jgi:hypothetical protein
LEELPFHTDSYGEKVAGILALDGGGARPMELFPRGPAPGDASEKARDLLRRAGAGELFPGARDPECALGALFLYFSYLDDAHNIFQTVPQAEGSYWHAIMHRMEGDAGNAGYWFHRVGRHPVFPALRSEAAQLGYSPLEGRDWDPFAFIRFCGSARKPDETDLAKRVQLAEWQLLFDYCATPMHSAAGKTETKVAAR